MLDWLAGKKTYIAIALYFFLRDTAGLKWLGMNDDQAAHVLSYLVGAAGVFFKVGQNRAETSANGGL